MNQRPIATTLGGTLQRHADGWRWSDGTPEPRVHDMLLSELAPNFRCCNHGGVSFVEIPAGWRETRFWPNGRVDIQAANEIEALIGECGKRDETYAEGLTEMLDNHRITKDGWLVDAAQWDAVMREQCGCWWDKADESLIYERAKSLGWKEP